MTTLEKGNSNNGELTTRKRRVATPSWRDAVSGAAAGAFSKTVTAPMERLKLLLQLRHSLETPQGAATQRNAWQVAKSIYQNEGLLSFWRGNIPSVMRVSGSAAINFTMMNYYKQVAVRPLLMNLPFLDNPQLSQEQLERRKKNLTSLISGGLAGGTSTTILYPIEFLRTRLAADLAKGEKTGSYRFRGMGHAIATIWKSDGIYGFYQGYGIALVGGIFYRVLFLGGYDVLKSETERRNKQDYGTETLSWGQRLVIAQTISLSAGTISYPLDSVRRRLMMQAGKPRAERLYRNSLDCIYQITSNEGIRGFFLGLGPNLLRSVSGALLLVAYDVFSEGLR